MGKLNIHCPHFSVCSGCVFNTEVDQSEVLLEAHQFFESIGVKDFALHCGHPIGWRIRAKVVVRGTVQNPVIGLFQKGSHQAVDIPFCRVHHPAINQAISEVRKWITTHKITPYNETSFSGLLRYLQLTVERKTSKVQLVLVFNEPHSFYHEQVIESLWKQNPELWHSIWVNSNTRKDNVIFGQPWQQLFGEKWLIESLRGQPVCFHPASFVQANLDMFEKLLEKIVDRISPQKDVLDLYAGVGAIGIAISDRCRSVLCVETNPIAKECFEETSKHLHHGVAEKLSFIAAASESCLHLLNAKNLHTVIVDPPRKGLDVSLLKALSAAENVKELVYVSCGWAAFQRDCKLLLLDGWHLRDVDAFLFFPGSNHLEILAFFVRKEK